MFGGIEAAEGPLAMGDFLDGDFLALGPRTVDAEEVGVEGLERDWVFIIEDHVALDRVAEFEYVLGGWTEVVDLAGGYFFPPANRRRGECTETGIT